MTKAICPNCRSSARLVPVDAKRHVACKACGATFAIASVDPLESPLGMQTSRISRLVARCPNCLAEYALKPGDAGKAVRCKDCREPFALPASIPEISHPNAMADETQFDFVPMRSRTKPTTEKPSFAPVNRSTSRAENELDDLELFDVDDYAAGPERFKPSSRRPARAFRDPRENAPFAVRALKFVGLSLLIVGLFAGRAYLRFVARNAARNDRPPLRQNAFANPQPPNVQELFTKAMQSVAPQEIPAGRIAVPSQRANEANAQRLIDELATNPTGPAFVSLVALGPAAEDAVLGRLRMSDDSFETKSRLCDVLAEIGTAKSLEPLEGLIRGRDRLLRGPAAHAHLAVKARN